MALRILAIEPYYGGSHAAFLEGLARRSRHAVDILSLPARKWKWRMRSAPLEIARRLDDRTDPIDLIFAGDFLDLATLVGLRPRRLADIPKVMYFHENQITYPVRSEDERDYHFAMTHLAAIHAADQAWFNSDFHRRDFLAGARRILHLMPDGDRAEWADFPDGKLRVEPLGLDLMELEPLPRERDGGAPVILWNHRWEFDKNPDVFLQALSTLDRRAIPYRLAVCGETFRAHPETADEIRARFGERIFHVGTCPTRAEYIRLLRRCDIVVSTAIHEFFGAAVVEAAAAGCFPLLPNRLSYPELIPAELHARHLYANDGELVERLESLCRRGVPESSATDGLREHLLRYDWSQRAAAFDAAFEAVIAQK